MGFFGPSIGDIRTYTYSCDLCYSGTPKVGRENVCYACDGKGNRTQKQRYESCSCGKKKSCTFCKGNGAYWRDI